MSEHDGMKGAACLVEAQLVSSRSHVGRMRAKWPIRARMPAVKEARQAPQGRGVTTPLYAKIRAVPGRDG